MKNIDNDELLELKRLRQNKLREDRPSKSIDELFNKTPKDNLLLEDEDENIPIPETKFFDNDDDAIIRFGKFKLKGIWEITVSIFTMVVFVVVAWVRFETTLRQNIDDIEQVKAQQSEFRNHVHALVPEIQQHIEDRLTHIERQLLILENQVGTLEYRADSQLIGIRGEVDSIKSEVSKHNSDITDMLRKLNRIESNLDL